MYILVRVIALCLFGACAFRIKCVGVYRKVAEARASLTAKWKYFHGFLTFTDGEYTCEM